MNTSLKNATDLSKKVYTRVKKSESNGPKCSVNLEKRLVLKAGATCSLKEQFKRLFLPLLHDVLELRQCIDQLNLKAKNNVFTLTGCKNKTPEALLADLEILKEQIQDSINWHDSIYKQITNAITDVQKHHDEYASNHCKNKHWMEKLTQFLKVK